MSLSKITIYLFETKTFKNKEISNQSVTNDNELSQLNAFDMCLSQSYPIPTASAFSKISF